MKQATGDIAEFIGRVSAICITTNGFVKNNGDGVMGRGIALQFSKLIPSLPTLLGNHIKTNGNVVGVLTSYDGTDIISFPVKPRQIHINTIRQIDKIIQNKQNDFIVGNTCPGFWAKADTKIISKSCDQLIQLKKEKGYKYIILPLPGSGAGELSYRIDIQPILLEKFASDDEMYIMSFKKEDFKK